MKLVDMIPYVLHGLRINGTTSQATLSMFVAGTSGRNSPKLTKNLFPTLAGRDLIVSYQEGRRTMWRLTEKGQRAVQEAPMNSEDLAWFQNHIQNILEEVA